MKIKTYQILSLTFGFQLLLLVLTLTFASNITFIELQVLQALFAVVPSVGYAIGLYHWPKLAKWSALPKMTLITIAGIALTIASWLMIYASFLVYGRLRYGYFPLGWGHE